MFRILYAQFRPYVWLGLCVLLLTGALSKYLRGRYPEAVLNAAMAVVCLVMGLRDLRKVRKDG
ncbi:MAG TPA: hypothetical protein V6D05_17385 [Stenomitos sp.]